jgi:phage replication-related protein YjqB (UPF0714/DUF867 family)
MHPTVKKIRTAVKHIDGAWVRRWKDGSIWVGCRYRFDIGALKSAVEHAGFSAEIAERNRFLEIIR